MSNLIIDIFESYLDKTKTISKSKNSGILENKVKEDFEFFRQDSGAFNIKKIFLDIQEAIDQEKVTKKNFNIKKDGSVLTIIWMFFVLSFIVKIFKGFN